MDKCVINELKNRVSSVELRENALQKELTGLVKEKTMILELVKYYESLDYDSIEEEHNITMRLVGGQSPNKLFKYENEVKLSLLHGQRLSAKQLSIKVSAKLSEPVSYDVMYHALDRMVKANKLGRYKNLFYKKEGND